MAIVLAAFSQKSHSLQWKVPKLGSQKVPEDPFGCFSGNLALTYGIYVTGLMCCSTLVAT